MHKKILRIFSLALALMLLLSVMPLTAQAANDQEVDRIVSQIKTLYRQTLRNTGKNSLHGYCGTMVNWQLYLMGITSSVIGNDGNTDNLEDALNAITYNGTRDAYNIVVGFERTNTVAGRRYGHTLMIHAILDGTVYYSESYSTTLDGKFYYEGSPITCSISDFARYYASWTVFEGVLHFGLKTYAESCEYFPSYLYATVSENTTLYTAPCTAEVDDRSKPVRNLLPGERLTVTGLYRNPEGEYWYQVEDRDLVYVAADSTQVLSMCYDDVTATGVGAPTVLLVGRTFDVKGKVKSRYNEITSVRAQVFVYGENGKSHVMSSSAVINGSSYSLSGTRLSNQLSFRLLEMGSYRYELAAVVGNYYFADGCLQTEWKTVKLWTSDFQVAEQTGDNCRITFDANGGNTNLNAMDVEIGDTLATLPEATRDGYVFAGWYTAAGQQVTEEYVVNGKTTLYAHWTSAADINGWYLEDGVWYYYENGAALSGFLEIDGIRYHLNADGYLDTGFVRVDGKLYYFHANGAMHFGWLELDGDTYYMQEDGSAAIGWLDIDNYRYKFSASGVMLGRVALNEVPQNIQSGSITTE